MDQHLAEGCESCARVMLLMLRINEESATEPVVLENLVNGAKAVFHERRTAESPAWFALPRLMAQLVFDSTSGRAQEGTRSAVQTMVQTVYHAGDYAIELQIERDRDSAGLALVGEVVNRAGSGRPLRGVAVVLMVRNKLIAEAESNDFGEFCLVARAQHGLKLCVHIEEIGKIVELPLTQIMAGRK